MIRTFTLTASPRAKILLKTLKSFSSNLLGISLSDCTVYANIDPIEFIECSDEIQKVVKVLNGYFKNVIYKVPEVPNFANALRYVWSQPSDELIFHMEDDWKLEMPINLNKMESYFYNREKLMQVRLRWKRCITKVPLYGLSPCIVRKEFYQAVALGLLPYRNPEWQIRKWGHKLGIPKPSNKSIFVIPKTYCVRDIGGSWKITRKISIQRFKKHDGRFTKWVTAEQSTKDRMQYKKAKNSKIMGKGGEGNLRKT